jgi:predicted metal-binding protein
VKQQRLSTIATGWTDLVLICRACSRKLDGGFGPDGDLSLRRALRQALRRRGQRGALGLVEVRCLGVCPKSGVTVARGSQAENLVVVPENFSAEALLDRLFDTTPPHDSVMAAPGDAKG